MPAMIGTKTIQDWLATPEGEHWELIHGNLVMTEETFGNSRLARLVERKIEGYIDTRSSGTVERNIAFSFPGIVDADREGVVPDLCYIPNDQLAKLDAEANVQKDVIPALAVEILSPSTRQIDLVDKVEIYRQAGVSEYWIFDRYQETVRIFRFAEDREHPVAVKSFDDTLTTPLLPGFVLNMPEIREALAIGKKGPDPSR